MKIVDTREYVSMLRELTDAGHEVSMVIAGSSMSPFLCHGRDIIYFKKKDRNLLRGDMVFYQRDTGQFVMHRIYKVNHESSSATYDLVGDAQTEIERGIREDQIFARITRVQRKGRIIDEHSVWWFFFARIWIRIIPLRHLVVRLYGMIFH